MPRKALIRKLLLSGHLNVPDRQTLQQKPITLEEAKEIIREELGRHKFFPPVTHTWAPDTFYYDGLVIEGRGDRYILHKQVSGAVMNIHSNKEYTMDTIDEAIDQYLQPRPFVIDGILLVE